MWKEKLLTLLQANRPAFALGSIGLLLIVIGIATTIVSENKSQGVVMEDAASTSAIPASSLITVDVSGAVVNPGVYQVSANARVQDALIAAGGLSARADRSFISKNINLALKISDGAKIYIPSIGEVERPSFSAGTNSSAQAVIGGMPSSGLVNINTASSSDLDTLPGIGPVTAGKIIDNRPYGSIDDLLTKKVVTKSVFEKIKAKITIQ